MQMWAVFRDNALNHRTVRRTRVQAIVEVVLLLDRSSYEEFHRRWPSGAPTWREQGNLTKTQAKAWAKLRRKYGLSARKVWVGKYPPGRDG